MKTSAFLIRVAICFLLSLVPLTDLEQIVYSARMQLRGKREAPTNIVLYHVSSLQDDLRSVLLQGPSAVLVSWYLPPDEAPEATREFTGLARLKRVVWSSRFDSESRLALPPKAFLSSGNHGFNNLLADSDGVIRRAVLSREGLPSVVLSALASKPPGAETPHLINFAGPAGTFPTCPGTGPSCASLRGKTIILARADDLKAEESSQFRTPLGPMSRAEILANEVNTVGNHKLIYEATATERALVTLAMILAAAFYIIYYPVIVSSIAVTGTAVVVIGVLFQLTFHLFDIYIPSTNAAAALLISYLVFTGYRLAVQENLQWRSLKQAQYMREMDQMKTNFLSLVSHDLKTPLAKIQAVVDRLRREPGPPPRDVLDSLENSGNELKRYITSVLSLSKIESQKVILNKKSNDINRIIEDVLRRIRSVAQTKQITIEESLEPLFSVECDEDLVRQVLTNLVDNAIKYSPVSSKVLVRSREDEHVVRVEVEDFGPGIPKDQLPLMFRKFNRFLRPMKEQVKGTGLGLYLSKYFIELHGGTIRVQSEEGKGTTFAFTLPLNGGEAETLLG